MRTSEAGLDLIRAFEAFRATPYVCPAGLPTVGYGHVIRPGEDCSAPLTEDDALGLLLVDVEAAERAVARLIRVPLAQGQHDALVSFTFNLGAGALQRSTLRQLVNLEAHDEVPEEFLRWIYAAGRPLRGLVRRRGAEARMYAGASGAE